MMEAYVEAEVHRIPAEIFRLAIAPEDVKAMACSAFRIGGQFLQQRLDRSNAGARCKKNDVARRLVPQEEGPKRPLDPDQVIGLGTVEPVTAQHAARIPLDDELQHTIRPRSVGQTVAAPDTLGQDVNILAGEKAHRGGRWSFEHHPDDIDRQPVDRYDPTWHGPDFKASQPVEGLYIQHHVARRRSATGEYQPLARLPFSQAFFDAQRFCCARYDRRLAYPAAPRSTAILKRDASIARGIQDGDGCVCRKRAAGVESYGRHVCPADSRL